MVAASEPDPIVEKKDMPPKVNSFEGIWAMVEADANGKHLPQEIEKEQRWIIGRNIIIVIHKDQSQEAFQYRLQPDGQPNSIDVWPLRFEGKPFQGLYQLKGDSLTVRYTRNQHPSAERPKHLKIEDDKQFDRGARYFVLRREKPLSMNNSTDSQSWSKAVNGLRGRLMLCDRGILNGTKILGINLELFNATTDTIRLTNDPQDVQVVLMNLGMGELVKESKLPRSGPIPNSGTCNLPRDAYLGFSLDSRTVGIPKNGPTLLPLHNHDWILKPGKYVLSASYSVTKRRSRPQGVWLGTVRLPPVVINIPH